MEDSLVVFTITLRRKCAIFLGICAVIAMPSTCMAKNNCPWINEATASGLLGGNAEGAFTDATPRQPADCTFTQQDSGVTRTLRITVEQSNAPRQQMSAVGSLCGPNSTPVRAIGNEAMMCSLEGHNSLHGTFMAGRARDQVFTITLRTTLKNDPFLTQDALQAKIHIAAEQVSGNLF